MEPTQAVEHIEPVEQPEPVPVIADPEKEPEQELDRINDSLVSNIRATNALQARVDWLEDTLSDVIARNCLLMKPLQAPTVEAGESHSADDKA